MIKIKLTNNSEYIFMKNHNPIKETFYGQNNTRKNLEKNRFFQAYFLNFLYQKKLLIYYLNNY